MNKKLIIILSISISVVVVSTALFTSLYFVLWRNNEEEIGFHVFLTDIDPVDMGTAERLEDLDYLYNFVLENYPFLSVKERMLGFNWLDLKSDFEKKISIAEDNLEFLGMLIDVIQSLQNLHTHLVNPGEISFYRDTFNDFGMYPYNETFSEKIEFANAYWINRYYSQMSLRHAYSFDVLAVYDKGEYILVDGTGDWAEDYGNRSKVIAVDGIPIDEAINNAYEQDYLSWDYIRDKPYCWYIMPRTFGSQVIFTIRNTTGHEKDVSFNHGYYQYANPFNYPTQRIYTDLLRNDTIGYVYLQSLEHSYIDVDYPVLMEFYEDIENCTHLIFDIRGNGGGSTNYFMNNIVTPLAKEAYYSNSYMAFRTGEYVQYFREGNGISFPANKSLLEHLPPEVQTDDFDLYNISYNHLPVANDLEFDGEIILLTDGFVYSAAEWFASFCKHTGFATLHGTTTGGDGLGMTPMYYVLPNSKLVIRISGAMGIDRYGYANEEVRTEPDYVYESVFGNWSDLINYACDNLP